MSNPPSRQGSGDLSAGAQTELIGYQPEYSFVNLQRLKLRSVMDTLVFESIVIVLVLIYAVILFIDMTISKSNGVDLVECRQAGNFPADVMIANASLSDLCSVAQKRDVLYYLDLIFLAIFLAEISLRLVGYGITFLRDPVQAIDATVVTLAFIIAVMPYEV